MTEPSPISEEQRRRSGRRGLILIAALITFSCLVPLTVIFISKGIKPTYHTQSLINVGECPHIQITWQSTPEKHLMHCFLFNSKNITTELEAYANLHIKQHTPVDGYYINPRSGMFYHGVPVMQKTQKKLRNRKLRFWIVEEGNLFPLSPPKELSEQWQQMNSLADTRLWKEFLQPELIQFRQKLAKGEIKLIPVQKKNIRPQ